MMAFWLTGLKTVGASQSEQFITVNKHHVAGINSGQPYVGEFQVLSDDFRVYRQIDGAQVTVTFSSTNTSAFPRESWLGAGMFLQAQDHKYLFIDYAFYVMVVLDSDGNVFFDIGLHQTMEGSLPIHQPDANLIYDYTWQLIGIDPNAAISLKAEWDSDGFVNYSYNITDNEFLVASIKPSAFNNCENMIPHFYQGNVIGEQFPLGRYVDFLQFGLTSSQQIANTEWQVILEDPKFLKQDNWVKVDKAWSVQGDISYLDQDARWGGEPYEGVDGQFPSKSDTNLHEVLFFFDGHTLNPGRVLWDTTSSVSNSSGEDDNKDPTLQITLLFSTSLLALASFGSLLWITRNRSRLVLPSSH